MRMINKVALCLGSVMLACGASASTVEIAGYDGNSIVKTVHGVWAYNGKVSFSDSGNYSLSIADFGFPSFHEDEDTHDFKFLGAMISTGTEKIASLSYSSGWWKNDVSGFPAPVEFSVDSGDYWLSVFAKTDAWCDFGTLGVEISEVTQVPVPAAGLLMGSAVVGLIGFGRRRKEIAATSKA